MLKKYNYQKTLTFFVLSVFVFSFSCVPNFTPTTKLIENSNISFTPYSGNVKLQLDTGLIERVGGKLLSSRVLRDLSFGIKSNDDSKVVLMKKNGDFSKHKTQKEHIEEKDKNILDPTLPDWGLGNLQPYQGETGSGLSSISVCEINGEQTEILTGRLVVEFSGDYENKLKPFLEKYDAVVLHSFITPDNTLFALIGLGETPQITSKIVDNIKKVNTIASPYTESINFSSINAVKTVATFYDIYANTQDLVSSVAFDSPSYQQGRSSSPNANGNIITNEEQFKVGDSLTSLNFDWLENQTSYSPKITQAWQYSQGEDTVVAVLDSGFGVIDKYPEFKDRVIYKKELLTNDYSEYLPYCKRARNGEDPSKILTPLGNFAFSSSQNILLIPENARGLTPDCYPYKLQKALNTDCTYSQSVYDSACYYDTEVINHRLKNAPDHGFEVASIISSSNDDLSHIAGVAPKSKILPVAYNANAAGFIDDYTFLLALSKLYSYVVSGGKVDVLSISSSLNKTSTAWDHLKNFSGSTFMSKNLFTLKKTGVTYTNPTMYWMNNLVSFFSLDLKIPVVVSAGNSNLDAGNFFPASCDDAISVGGYQIKGSSIERGSYDKDKYSNYGKAVDVWGQSVDVLSYLPSENEINFDYTQKYLKGTSFATPAVSGLVALLKSWNKNLTGTENTAIYPSQRAPNVKSILQDSGYSLPSTGGFIGATSNQRAINAYKSITDSRVGAKKYTTIWGVYNSDNTIKQDSGGFVVPTYNYTKTYSDLVGKHVAVTGWLARDRVKFNPNLKANPENIELLQIRETQVAPTHWYIRIYNVDDTGTAIVNFNVNNQYTAYYSQDTGFIDITNLVNIGNNIVEFKMHNNSGGYTWGFQLKRNDTLVFNDRAGTAGVQGANKNDNKAVNQDVYDKKITFDTAGNLLNICGFDFDKPTSVARCL